MCLDSGVNDDPPAGIRLRAYPSLCQGWGQCHRWAPDVYPLDDEGRIDMHVLDVPPHRLSDATLGAFACPERAISIVR